MFDRDPDKIEDAAQARTLKAMKSLPSSLRKVLVLREIEGLPMEEVARRLHISVRSAERRWTRAVELMVKRVGKLERDGR